MAARQRSLVVQQGDVYWLELDEPAGSEPAYRHPCVVVQNDDLNRSRIRTAVVCLLSSNLRLAGAPGNVLLRSGEANLPRDSVVNVTQIVTVDKSVLDDWVGSLSPGRVRQIVAGIGLVVQPSAPPSS